MENQEDNSQFIILPLSRPQHTQLTPKGTFFLGCGVGKKTVPDGSWLPSFGGWEGGFSVVVSIVLFKNLTPIQPTLG